MRFEIPLTPVAKGRPKMSARGGFARAYTPAKTREFESQVRMFAQMAMDGPPMTGPLYLRAEFFFEHPKGQWRKRNPLPEGWKVTKPDVDNLCKALLDGLEGPCFASDAQVVWIVARKMNAAQGASSRVVVTVEPVQP